MKTSNAARMRSQLGSALVEFSVSVFLLLLMMLGVVELQRMLFVYNTIADSARAGARYAIVHGLDASPAAGPTNTTPVSTVVTTFASASLLDTSKLSITVTYPNYDAVTNPVANKPGDPVKVVVQYPYDPFVGWFTPILSVTLKTTSRGIICY